MRPHPRRAPACVVLWLQGWLLLGLAGAAAGVAYLPTHDGPQHVFATHAANHLDEPGTGWSRWLEPRAPVTNHGFSLLFTPLDAVLPWPLALRATLALMVLLWGSGAFALACALHPERGWLGLALAGAAFQWSLYMGLFSFYVASAFGLWVLAVGFGARSWRTRQCLALATLVLLQALMHVVAAILTGALLATLALLRAAPGRRLVELGRVALVGAPASLVALALARVGLGALGDYNEAGGGVAVAQLPPWWTLGKCFAGGPAWRAWPLTLLALSAPALAWAAGRGRRLSPEDRTLLGGGAALLAAAAILPLHVRAWDFFSVRCLPLGVSALLLAVPFERLRARGRRTLAAGALAAFAFAATGWAFVYNRALGARAEAALAGLDAGLRRDGLRLPIVLDPYLGRPFDDAEAPMPYSVPLLNLGQLYAAAQGGVVPYAFVSNPHLHTLVMSEERRRRLPEPVDRRYAIDLADPHHAGDPGLRAAVLAYVAGRATRYQDVILWGRPDDADRLLGLGFEPDFRRDGLVIARFRGCPLSVRFPPGAPVEDGTVFEIGWGPAWHVTHRYHLERAQRQPDGGRRLPLRQSCGAVWLAFQDPALSCDGADEHGRLLIASTRATPEVECRVRVAPRTAKR